MKKLYVALLFIFTMYALPIVTGLNPRDTLNIWAGIWSLIGVVYIFKKFGVI
jgi:hypothetical protein